MVEKSDVLVLDIETNSLDVYDAKLKWFGAYSYIDNKYYLLDYTQKSDITKLISRHSVIVTFNGNEYDIPILQNNGYFSRIKIN